MASQPESSFSGHPAAQGEPPAVQDVAASDIASRLESEVKRTLARELHDSVAQILTVMVVDLENFKHDHSTTETSDGVVEKMGSFQNSAREVLQNLRELLYELREEPGHDHSFVPKVRMLLSRFEGITGIHAKLSVSAEWPGRLAADTAYNLYRIIEASLNNVRLHSGAASVGVWLDAADQRVMVTVQDDGRGLVGAAGVRASGMGMVGMQERAVLLGGRLEVSSDDQHAGTVVTATIPIKPAKLSATLD